MNVKLMIAALLLGLAAARAAGAPVDYQREVKPIFAARCTSCHGVIRQKAGLRLDTAFFVRRGGDGGPAVEPGKSGESLLIDRVTGADGADRMPPVSEGVGLSQREVAVLRAWIDQGALAPPEPTPEDPRSTGLTNLRRARVSRARKARPGPKIRSTLFLPRVTGHVGCDRVVPPARTSGCGVCIST